MNPIRQLVLRRDPEVRRALKVVRRGSSRGNGSMATIELQAMFCGAFNVPEDDPNRIAVNEYIAAVEMLDARGVWRRGMARG